MTLLDMPSYTNDLFSYRRRPTRVVMVGEVGVGGDNPIRVQSMTTTLTKNVEETAAQTRRLVEAGCEIVRITTPTPDDARCLQEIRGILDAQGVRVPIVADIHFSPLAAMVAADFADKVRVNPGNYVDSRKFAVREYSDADYREEVERMAERFTPLVLKCKERGIAMRIGTNHGSLSDRIMNRFGDTPEGMVESALEFVHVCRANGYHDIILSMKASNPKVMIAAYRLLAARMDALGMNYPFHLGVTEAGNAEDGRIKSAIGIGSLLNDGIGDTIRVSLTEEPEDEIPVARAIADRYAPVARKSKVKISSTLPAWDPIHYERRTSKPANLGGFEVGGSDPVAVLASVEAPAAHAQAAPRILRWASPAGRRQPKPEAAWLRVESDEDLTTVRSLHDKIASFPGANLALLAAGDDPRLLCPSTRQADGIAFLIGPRGLDADELEIISLEAMAARTPVILAGVVDQPENLETVIAAILEACRTLEGDGVAVVLSLEAPSEEGIAGYRLLATRAAEAGIIAPILLQMPATGEAGGLEWLLTPSIQLGSLLCDGIGDAVMVHGDGDTVGLAFNILQASGTRIFKTDYVACPSCGRTLFDLQETTDRIKSRTSHLVGVKLAIMGCIVNGPGEMADADFGYVGGAPGKVNLYVGKECVVKGVPVEEADDRLIALIKSHGRWEEDEGEDSSEAAENNLAGARLGGKG